MFTQSLLFVTRRWGRDGGVGAHVIASARALAAHGVRIDVFAARVESDERVPGVTLHERPALFDSEAPMHERLGEAPTHALDAIHVHQLDDPQIVRALSAIAPVVVSAHGYTACTSGVYYFRPGHECTRAHGPGCAVNLLARGCAHTRQPQSLPASYRRTSRELEALRCADLVVAYSSSVERHLANNGLARRRVVPLFSTMTPRTGTGHESRRLVLFAGRLAAPKGIDVLLRAIAQIDGELVVCGSGWRLDSSRKLARRLGIEHRVDFKGWLAADALAQEFADASVVVVPSLWPEPFGLVGIEAHAAGRPVVASATGGIADWLDDGVNGLLVQPGDASELAHALNELLADTDRQRTMGAAGREAVAQRFTPERHIAALLDGYREARAHWEAQRDGLTDKPPPVAMSS